MACVLLVVLWVRSYWRQDVFALPLATSGSVWMSSIYGVVLFCTTSERGSRVWERDDAINDAAAAYWKRVVRPKTFAGFGVDRSTPVTVVLLPHWFAVLVFATSAAAPWMRWSKRFRLRTLLIATTLVAVVLGLIVWAVR
jgi:hypothetical protein